MISRRRLKAMLAARLRRWAARLEYEEWKNRKQW